jgi:hypothetical protein
VAICPESGTARSGTSESTLSPPPESPRLDPANTIAVQKRGVEGNHRTVSKVGDVANNALARDQAVLPQNEATSDQLNQATSNEQLNENKGEESSNEVTVSQNPDQEQDNDDFPMFTIAPYIAGEFDQYEYEPLKGDPKQLEPEDELKDEEALNDPEDPKVSDELNVIDEQEDLEDPVTPNNEEADETQIIEEDIYGADSPRIEPATPQIFDEDVDDIDSPLPENATPRVEDLYAADTPRADSPTPLAATELINNSNINGTNAIIASEALTNALSEMAADVSTLEVPALSDATGAEMSRPPKLDGADVAPPSQATANTDNGVDSEVTSQVAVESQKMVEKVIIEFKKFTPLADFRKFLENADSMSYDELYHRTAAVSGALEIYQEEWDYLDKQTFSYERRKEVMKENALEEKKDEEDRKKADIKEASRKEDEAMRDLFHKYENNLKVRGSAWQAFLVQFQQRGGDPQDLERLRRLHDPAVVTALGKRIRLAQKEATKKTPLTGGDLPPLKKADRAPQFKKRRIIQDRVVFDERKQADVYAQNYNSKMTGNQKLLDRNAVDFGEDDSNEGGRPKRSTAKRAFYDTEQSESAPDTEPEALPAKRARTKRILDDGIASPGRPQTLFESRDGTPARVFPSGKRVGRPPGSKTKNPGGKATTQSKLNTVQVAEPSESEAEDGKLPNNEVESLAQELDLAQEQQLQAAATSLVAQTVGANVTAGEPVKKKHAGGRPKKNVAVEEPIAGPSNAPVGEVPVATKPKNKGGRPRKHPIPAGGAKARGGRGKKAFAPEPTAVQVGEEEEVIQSTEHDNESLFPSTSTSRPTTSSSGGTDGTFGGRPTRRAATRGKSQAQSASINLEDQPDAPGPSASTNGRSRRKRTVTEDNQIAQPIESGPSGDSEGDNIIVDTYRLELLEEVAPPKKRKPAVRTKRGKATAQAAAQPITPQEEVTPEQTGEGLNSTGRPKRKRAAALPESSIDPDLLGEYLSDDDGESPPPPKRRNARGGRKGKSVKREQTTDIDTGVDGDSSVPPSRKRAVRAVTKKNTVKQEMGYEESSGDSQVPQPPKTRKSRTNTLIVAEGAGPMAMASGSMAEIGEGPSAPAPKKRITSGGKQAAKDVEIMGENIVSKKRKALAVGKGKGIPLRDMIEPEIKNEEVNAQNGENADLELDGHDMADNEPPTKKRKVRAAKGKAVAPKTEDTGDEFEDSEDYTGIDPVEAELLRKKKRKSKKLAEATRKRWASGTMKGPMEKRKATNAAKKAAKLAADAAKLGGGEGAAVAGPSGTQLTGGAIHGDSVTEGVIGAVTGETMRNVTVLPVGNVNAGPVGNVHAATMGNISAGAMGAGPGPARASTRVRKPTIRAMGLDGADDYSEDEGDFRSEYDKYQALTSPKGEFTLGKRARKSYVGFDDDEESF